MITEADRLLFVNTLKGISSYDFSQYSEKSLTRRIEKVLSDNQLNLTSFLGKLRSDKPFLEKTVKDITVNTTELFRDVKAWHALKYRILPKLAHKNIINIWHAGSSTGQEIYSMLILLSEMNLFDKTNVYATDLNTDVIDIAKKGVYKYRFNLHYLNNFDKVIKENPYNYEEFNDVPYSKYFDIDKTKDTLTIHKFLRDKPRFYKHNLVSGVDPFHLKFDLILCRNVIIYFNYDLQNKVFTLFHNNLLEQGRLLLGMHETIIGPLTTKFSKKGMAYIKK